VGADDERFSIEPSEHRRSALTVLGIGLVLELDAGTIVVVVDDREVRMQPRPAAGGLSLSCG